MALKNYRELDSWKKAMDFVEVVYELTSLFPDEEKFGLTSQLRRAAVSIPSNIAEGYGRAHRGDYLHHLSIANGSLTEAETQLILAVRLKFVSKEQASAAWALSQDLGKLLRKLQESLRPVDKPKARNPKPDELS
jgi:four helix bundle protein